MAVEAPESTAGTAAGAGGRSPVLEMTADPADLGFDAERLRRIDAHFGRYVDDGRLVGWQALVSRRGSVAHLASAGQRDREAGLPVDPDTLWRIYSMTKPITSVAAMMLVEQGLLDLKDPVSAYIPSFAQSRVLRGGSATTPLTDPVTSPMLVWHLMTHTAGLTYGFHHAALSDRFYREAGFEWGTPPGLDLAALCDIYAGLPLAFQPGTAFNYSVATDVLGRIIEIVSGQPLDTFLTEHILAPLGMVDTAFSVEDEDAERLAALYIPHPATQQAVRNDAFGNAIRRPPSALSGGGGLVSTLHDYHRFTQMLLRGGELDGVRLLGSRTMRYMTRNHLPGGVDLEAFGQATFAETSFDGVGFGLGFSVVQSPVANKTLSTAGEFAWGGAASTAFWVDPVEAITVIFMTQLLPSSKWPIRPELKKLVYGALVDEPPGGSW